MYYCASDMKSICNIHQDTSIDSW